MQKNYISLMKHNLYFLISFLITFSFCQKSGKITETSSEKINIDSVTKAPLEMPQSPEAVVREWEENINKNQFELPLIVSKGEVLKFVNSVEASNEEQKLPVFPMKILSLKCNELNNVGNCTCQIQNDTGEQTFQYTLIKDNGQWYLTKIESVDDFPTLGTDRNKLKSL